MILEKILRHLGMVYVPADKAYVKVHVRYLSEKQGSEDTIILPSIGSEVTPSEQKFAKAQKLNITKEEFEIAEILNDLAPDILDVNKSVVQAPIPADTLDKLFRKNVKFSEKVASIKGYLSQPLRTALVEKMPSHDSDVVKHPANIQSGIELLYVLRCIVAVLPEFNGMVNKILEGLAATDPKLITSEKISEISAMLTKMRGISAPASAVASAALKVFYTVDGMAFDEFSVNLTALEWEMMTANMNTLRLEFAQEIRQQSTFEYHNTTSKQKKLQDKAVLDQKINDARIPLVKISKLTLEDLHRQTQLNIQAALNLSDSNKKISYDRKALLSKVRSIILAAYRENPNLDILKHAAEFPIEF